MKRSLLEKMQESVEGLQNHIVGANPDGITYYQKAYVRGWHEALYVVQVLLERHGNSQAKEGKRV